MPAGRADFTVLILGSQRQRGIRRVEAAVNGGAEGNMTHGKLESLN